MRHRRWILSVLLATAVIATGAKKSTPPLDPNCPPSSDGQPIDAKPFREVMAKLETRAPAEWMAATSRQILAAPCLRTQPFTEAEMLRWAEGRAKADSRRISRKVNGIAFKNESPELIELFERLTTVDPHTNLAPAFGQRQQRTFASKCETVLCAVQDPAIFERGVGLRLLYLQGRFGFNGSQHAFADAEGWQPEELDPILLSLNSFPGTLFPLRKSKQLTRYPRGRRLPNDFDGSSIATARINVGDLFAKKSQGEQLGTIFHETGHFLASLEDLAKSPQWRAFSGWKAVAGKKGAEEEPEYRLGKPSAVPSKYGTENPGEDFAESMVAYRFNPAELKRRSPEKYAFLRDVIFDGLEYASADACKPERALSLRLARKASPSPRTPATTLAAGKACGDLMVKALTSRDRGPEWRKCLQAHLATARLAASVTRSDSAHLELTRKYLHHRASVPDGELVEPAELAGIQTELHGQLRGFLTAALKATSEGTCSSPNEDSFQFFDRAGLKKHFATGPDSPGYFSFEHWDPLHEFVKARCAEIRSRSPSGPFNNEEIAAAIEPHLSL